MLARTLELPVRGPARPDSTATEVLSLNCCLNCTQVVIFCDFNFEDMEVMYPKIRLEEEKAKVLVVGAHPAGYVHAHILFILNV